MSQLEIPATIVSLIGRTPIKMATKDYVNKIVRAYNNNAQYDKNIQEIDSSDVKSAIWKVLNGMELDELGIFIKEHMVTKE